MNTAKNIAALLLLAIVFITCEDNDPAVSPADRKPEPTAVGTSTGQSSTKIIGVDGGSLSSVDGQVELEFPAGALSSNTKISIEPITNYAPGGVNSAYRFLPEGQVFIKPVTVKFYFTEEDLAGSASDFLGIAFQDADHVWYRVKDFTIDETNNFISAPIGHFSDWSSFEALAIIPPTGAIKVNETIDLKLVFLNTGNDEDLLAPLFKRNAKVTWSANGIVNGDASVGTLTGNGDLERVYKAPAEAPSENPVAVSAKVRDTFTYNGETFTDPLLVSNIKILDGYLLELKYESNVEGKIFSDSASMTIKIKDGAVTGSDYTNFPLKITPASYSEGDCTVTWLPDNKGLINVTNVGGQLINAGNTSSLNLIFTHSSTSFPNFRVECPEGTRVEDGVPFPGVPDFIPFTLTEQKVIDSSISVPGQYSLTARLTQN